MSFGKSKSEIDSASGSVGAVTQPAQAASRGSAFLGQGSKVVGTLNFSGPVELDGFIEGELNAQDKLVVGESAVVNARINGSEILVKGTVNGDISASKRLILQRPAKVTGNISSLSLSIEEGVVFEGQCSMISAQGPRSAGVKHLSQEKSA